MPTQTSTTDSFLWYGETIPTISELGFVVPNPSIRLHTSNDTIRQWVADVMRMTQAIMLTRGVLSPTKIKVDLATDIHKQIKKSITWLQARMVADNEAPLEPRGGEITSQSWLFYPVPLMGPQVKQANLKGYAARMLSACTEAMSHEDNKYTSTVSKDFVTRCVSWLRTVYTMNAVDNFGVDPAIARSAGFEITQEMITAYSLEDSVSGPLASVYVQPNAQWSFTNEQYAILTSGIPATELPANMRPWPSGVPAAQVPPTVPLPESTGSTITASNTGSSSPTAAVTAGTLPADASTPKA